MSRLRITNDKTTPLTIWVEPWGRDYTLLPAESCDLTPVDTDGESYLHALWGEGDAIVYAEGDWGEVLVQQDGVELQCGHNRQGTAG